VSSPQSRQGRLEPPDHLDGFWLEGVPVDGHGQRDDGGDLGGTVRLLEFLASYAPSYAFRLVLLAGTTGNRINELFALTDDPRRPGRQDAEDPGRAL
jgi:hypothetical protein